MTRTPEERALDWLGKASLRPTRQRVAIASLLIGDGEDRHVCAESVFEATRATDANVSLATIYNTLHLFCEAGLINEVKISGQKSYFDTRVDDHPHFFWEDSELLIDAPKDAVAFEKLPNAPEGAEIAGVDVVIRLRHAK